MLTYQQRAAEVMAHLVEHDWHGYSQVSRGGDGGVEPLALSDGTVVEIATGDRDCSSAVISAWEAVLPGSTGGATYTGDMRSCFVGTGLWEWHPMGDGYIAQTGDVYLNEAHHTAMCKSAEPDVLMQFSISETGGIDGAEGDQTGYESNTRPYYDYPWDGKLVYVGPQPQGEEDDMFTDQDRAKLDQLVRTDDVSGRGTVENMYGRVCCLGADTKAIIAAVDRLASEVMDIKSKVEMLGE